MISTPGTRIFHGEFFIYAPSKFTPDKFALVKFAFFKFTLDKFEGKLNFSFFAILKSDPLKFAPLKLDCSKSIPCSLRLLKSASVKLQF